MGIQRFSAPAGQAVSARLIPMTRPNADAISLSRKSALKGNMYVHAVLTVSADQYPTSLANANAAVR